MFTIVIGKYVKRGRATNSMRVPEWVVSPNWLKCFDMAYIAPDPRTYFAILCGFIFAMESYLEHRGRDCHAGRYRFMNNSSRNCLDQCACSIPGHVSVCHVYLSIRAFCTGGGVVLVSGVGYRAKYFKMHIPAADALFTMYNRPHVKRDLMRIYILCRLMAHWYARGD